MTCHLPSEPIMRAKNRYLVSAISFHYFIASLLTARCASRGMSLFWLFGYHRALSPSADVGDNRAASKDEVVCRCTPFCTQQNRPLASSFTVWLPPTGSRRACRETVYSVERETGLEPATACLEGRWLHSRRSLDLHRPDSRFDTIHAQCVRV